MPSLPPKPPPKSPPKKRPHRILVVEDNLGDVDLVKVMLSEDAPGEFDVFHAKDLTSALARMRRESYDLVLLDLGLPDADGLDGITRVRKAAADVPIVVLTGVVDQATGIAAIERGAQSYAVKGWEGGRELLKRIRQAIGRGRALGELAAVSDTLKTAGERLKKIGPESRAKKP